MLFYISINMNTLNKLKHLLFFTLFLLVSCGSGKAIEYEEGPLVNYEAKNTLASVLDRATEEGKIVFIDMYADWCLPCKVMDADVFGDQATADFMNANFINYKVNGEKGEGPDLVVLFGVEGYPTQLFLDNRGNIIEKNLGSLGIVGFNVLAERALAQAKNLK